MFALLYTDRRAGAPLQYVNMLFHPLARTDRVGETDRKQMWPSGGPDLGQTHFLHVINILYMLWSLISKATCSGAGWEFSMNDVQSDENHCDITEYQGWRPRWCHQPSTTVNHCYRCPLPYPNPKGSTTSKQLSSQTAENKSEMCNKWPFSTDQICISGM